MTLNHTHHPAARSWLESANTAGCDFPIQNLPFAVFRRRGTQEVFRGGVAIGDQVIDLASVAQSGCFAGLAAKAAHASALPVLNSFFAMGPAAWQALRHALFAALDLSAIGPASHAVQAALVPQDEVEYAVPAHIGDYTDFYTSIHHAANISKLVRPDNLVSPNFHWMPIAYHGRSSSIGVSGQAFRRPMGQAMPPGAEAPVFGPCTRLDYELELGAFIGKGNALGEHIRLEDADAHVFGICLLNDWSARDIQFWEMAPLGPFHGKNFATTISPWIVTLEALAPFRKPWERPAGDPQPLPYLESSLNRAHGAFDIQLEVWLESSQLRAAGAGPQRLSHTSFKHQYWSIAQMVAHHSVGGCNLQPGDLLGSGTISGPTLAEAGAMIELTTAGRHPVTLTNGEQRGFLQDGDTVILRGWCEQPGQVRIGFGECRGEILPAVQH